MGLYKCCSKIRLGADKIWDCSLWWLGRALQRLLCLAQEVDWFSKFKTEKTGLGISGPGYVLLLQYSALVMLTVCAWQCLLPLAGSYGAAFAAFAQCLGACLWCVSLHSHASSRNGQFGLWGGSWEGTEQCCGCTWAVVTAQPASGWKCTLALWGLLCSSAQLAAPQLQLWEP